MSEERIKEIADGANFIVAGYSFTNLDNGNVQVINLAKPENVCILNAEGEMLKTTMDDNSLLVARAYYIKNKEFMEVEHA